MHAYTRISGVSAGGGGHSAPSSPRSPLRSPRLRPGRLKSGRFQSPAASPPRTAVQRAAWSVLSLFLRRQGLFLFAPLIYISGMLLYMGTVSLDVSVLPEIKARSPPGSLYRSPKVYEKLRRDMNADNFSDGVSCHWVSFVSLFYDYELCLRVGFWIWVQDRFQCLLLSVLILFVSLFCLIRQLLGIASDISDSDFGCRSRWIMHRFNFSIAIRGKKAFFLIVIVCLKKILLWQ